VGRLYNKVKSRRTLERSFRKVRDHAVRSPSRETRQAVSEFGKDFFGSIDKLQKRLGKGNFEFHPQRGIAKRKRNSPDYRPLVVAPFEDRIIQRAILEVLIEDVSAVKQVMSTQTSIGGIPGRGVRNAIELVVKAMEEGAKYFVRSDIESFFTRIPKAQVKSFIADHVRDREFVSLFDRALDTELENLDELAEHKSLFPLGDDGVAQGSALSTLAGNIVLNDFDHALNDRGIICVRYVDDFLILGPDESRVKKAFESSQALLSNLKMRAYSPWLQGDKAAHGLVSKGFTFLGCDINSDGKVIQPSRRARTKLIRDVATVFAEALSGLAKVLKSGHAVEMKFCYGQVIVRVSTIISGWRHAFRFCNCSPTFESLNHEIDKLIQNFSAEFRKVVAAEPLRVRRHLLGVQLL
jgi:retron-type reverse transcriptase